MNPIALEFFGLTIYRYGIFYMVSFMVAYAFFYYVGHTKIYARIDVKVHELFCSSLDDILLIAMIGVIVGGRLGHVIIYNWSYYLSNPIEILMINEGGMSFIGGILGVVSMIMVFLYSKKFNRTQIFRVFDTIVVIVPFGSMLGRRGNYINQELYGTVVSPNFVEQYPIIFYALTQMNILHMYTRIDSDWRRNTNILASFLEGFLLLLCMVFLFFVFYRKGKMYVGQLGALYLMGYSCARFILEFIREDSQNEIIKMLDISLSISQWIFVVLFLIGFIIYICSFIFDIKSHEGNNRQGNSNIDDSRMD